MTIPWAPQANTLIVIQTGPGFTGFFEYSGAPTTGNLIASIAPNAGTDPQGNAYLAGFTTYTSSGGTFYAINQNGQTLTLTSAASAGGPYSTIDATLALDGTFTNLVITAANSILMNPQNGNVQIPLLDLTNQSFAPAGVVGGALLYAQSGTPYYIRPSGEAGAIPNAQIDQTLIAVTAATPTALTNAWSMIAADTAVGTTYRITTWGFGTLGSTLQNLTIGVGLNGTQIRSVTVASPGTVSQSFRWNAVVELAVHVLGSGGNASVNVSGWWGNAPASGVATETTFTAGSPSQGADAFNTTTNNTLELMASWASTTGAPTISSVYSRFERLGP